MTPELVTALVRGWVRLYTRDLPPAAAERRRDEIAADLHDHVDHDRSAGVGERRIALRVAGRMVRGVPADASWRRTVARSSTTKEPTPMSRSTALRILVPTVLALLVPLVGTLVSDSFDWGVFDFVLLAVLVAGAGWLLDLVVRRPRSLVYPAGAAVLGVAAMAAGEADDAPGLVLIGLLLLAGTAALTFRTLRRG